MKQFIKLRFKLSETGRENPILVYADTIHEALQKVRERLQAEYPKGYRLVPNRVEVFTDAIQANLNCGYSRGLFDALSPEDLQEYLADKARIDPPPKKQKAVKRSSFDRECDRRIQEAEQQQVREQCREQVTA